jgi:hypothetical protein
MTWGANEFPPLGLSPFSVGETGAAELGVGDVVAVVVVVVVVGDGAWLLLLAHPALIAPTVMSAAHPTTVITRRGLLFCESFIAGAPLACSFLHFAVGFQQPQPDFADGREARHGVP